MPCLYNAVGENVAECIDILVRCPACGVPPNDPQAPLTEYAAFEVAGLPADGGGLLAGRWQRLERARTCAQGRGSGAGLGYGRCFGDGPRASLRSTDGGAFVYGKPGRRQKLPTSGLERSGCACAPRERPQCSCAGRLPGEERNWGERSGRRGGPRATSGRRGNLGRRILKYQNMKSHASSGSAVIDYFH